MKTNMLRSSFGGHFAGTGIVQDVDMSDDYNIKRGVKVYRSDILPTDLFGNDKDAFEAYCIEQSGDVTTYKLAEDGTMVPTN